MGRCPYEGIYGALPQTPAAMCRSNFRERVSENNKFNLPRKQARFRAINASTKTQTKTKLHITKAQKFHKTLPVLARSR